MKGIKLCGECGNYDYKKHRCRIGCKDDSDAQASFYGDCPLPDVVPTVSKMEQVRLEVAREIFAEIDVLVDDWKHSRIQSIQFIAELAELKKKYTEEQK